MSDRYMALVAFLSCIIAIVVLTIVAAVVLKRSTFTSPEQVAQALAALGFINSAVTGLVAVAGTFRPRAAMTEETKG